MNTAFVDNAVKKTQMHQWECCSTGMNLQDNQPVSTRVVISSEILRSFE